jgi:hypothetical protein
MSMNRKFMMPAALAALLFLGGCATRLTPLEAETERQVVLKYLGTDVQTAGPISREGKVELAVLSAKDREAALALLSHGAVGFLIIGADPKTAVALKTGDGDSLNVERIIFVAGTKITGDFRVEAKAAASP